MPVVFGYPFWIETQTMANSKNRHVLLRTWKFQCWLLGLFMIQVLASDFLFAQSASVTNEIADDPKLIYRVTPVLDVKGIFIEPLSLVVELTNKSNKPVTINWGDDRYSTNFQFEIIHEKTGQKVAVGKKNLPHRSVLEAAELKYFKTIEAGQSISATITLGNSDREGREKIAYFRQSGRYVVRPSLHVSTNKVLEPISETVSELNDAWTGDIEGNSFTIDMIVPTRDPISDSRIVGSIVSPDGKPVPNAFISLRYATDGSVTFERTNSDFWDQTYSDDDGRFEFLCVPDHADFKIYARHPAHPNTSMLYKFADFKNGIEPVVTMPKSITIRGNVVDSKKKPLSKVRVRFSGHGTNAEDEVDRDITDENGKFAIVVADENYGGRFFISLLHPHRVFSRSVTNRLLALSGDWEIAMATKAELEVQGHAIFADGTPLSKMKIELNLSSISPESKVEFEEAIRSNPVQAVTDESGHFKAILPMNTECYGVAVAQQSSDNGTSRRWECKIPRLVIGSEPLELQFENRGVIQVNLFGTAALPENAKLSLRLHSTKYNQSIIQEQLSIREREKVYEYLEPGEYKVRVSIQKFGLESPETTVVIPNEEPFFGLAKIQFAKATFGGIKAKLFMPDGQTPARNLQVFLFGERDIRSSGKTDNDGRIDMQNLPTGKIWLSVRTTGGFTPVVAEANVASNTTIDLGEIQIKSENSGFFWLEGTVAYDGGGSVGRVELSRRFGAFTERRSGDPYLNLDWDGGFRVQVPRGSNEIGFKIYGISKPNPGAFSFMQEVERNLILKLDVDAGNTVRHDLAVPRREDCRDVVVTWIGEDVTELTIATEWQDDRRWIYSGRSFRSFDSSGTRIKTKPVTFASFPTSMAYIVARSDHPPIFSIQLVPPGHLLQKIVFNQEELGSLEVSVFGANDELLDGFKVSMCTTLMNEKLFVNVSLAKDGQVVVNNLGAAKYLLTVSTEKWKHDLEIDLELKTKLVIKLKVDSNGKLLDKQFESHVFPQTANTKK